MGRLATALADLSEIGDLEKLWQSGEVGNGGGPHSDMLRRALFVRAGTMPGAGAFFLERLRELKPGSLGLRGSSGSEQGSWLVSAVIAASSPVKPDELEAICMAVGEALFGKDFDFEGKGNGNDTYSDLSSLEKIFSSATLDPPNTARLYATFFRLGIPVGINEHYILHPFRSMRFTTVEEAEKFFETCGWLGDAQTWQAFAVVAAQISQKGGVTRVTCTDSFLLPKVLTYMHSDFPRPELAKHLEARQPRTFGSLITAASLSNGAERTRLTELAFATAAPDLKNLPPERLRDFLLAVPWLPETAIANLPPAFRKE